MKIKALREFCGITKDKIYEVVGKRQTEVCVIDDTNDNHWLTYLNYEIVKEEPTLKEKYFVSGNVVETREGKKYLVVNDCAMRLDGETYIEKYNVKDDLTGSLFSFLDYMKVYKITCLTSFNEIGQKLELIWQREPEVKEVTIAELEKHYGCKVKVVK